MTALKLSARGSWHLSDPARPAYTYCGRFRDLDTERTLPELPGNERTCERCAVIASKRAEIVAPI